VRVCDLKIGLQYNRLRKENRGQNENCGADISALPACQKMASIFYTEVYYFLVQTSVYFAQIAQSEKYRKRVPWAKCQGPSLAESTSLRVMYDGSSTTRRNLSSFLLLHLFFSLFCATTFHMKSFAIRQDLKVVHFFII